jgi:hypothetical protein
MTRYTVLVQGGATDAVRLLLKEPIESKDEAEKLAKQYKDYWERHGHKTKVDYLS